MEPGADDGSSPDDVADEPVGLLAGADWLLGTRHPLLVLTRWTLIGIAVLIGLGAFGVSIAAMIDSGGGGGGVAGWVWSGTAGPFALSVGYAMFESWAFGKGGWWGQTVQRLTNELTSVTGRVYGQFDVVAGLRVRHGRPFLLLFAEHRMVMVSRGWSGVVVAIVLGHFAMMILPAAWSNAALLALPATMMYGVMFNWVALILMGRRVNVHEIPYDAVRSMTPQKRDVVLDVTANGLPRSLQFLPFEQQRARLVAQVLARCPQAQTSDRDESPDAAIARGEALDLDAHRELHVRSRNDHWMRNALLPVATALCGLAAFASLVSTLLALFDMAFGPAVPFGSPAQWLLPGFALPLLVAFFMACRRARRHQTQGWWDDVAHGLPGDAVAVPGVLRARLPLLGQLRVAQRQHAMVVFAQDWLVLIVRAWNGIWVLGVFVWPIALVLAAKLSETFEAFLIGGIMMAIQAAWISLLIAGRSVRTLEVPFAVVAEIAEQSSGELVVHVQTGRRAETLKFRAAFDHREALLQQFERLRPDALRRVDDPPAFDDGVGPRGQPGSAAPPVPLPVIETDEHDPEVAARLARVQQKYQDGEA